MCVSDRVSRHEDTQAAMENKGLLSEQVCECHLPVWQEYTWGMGEQCSFYLSANTIFFLKIKKERKQGKTTSSKRHNFNPEMTREIQIGRQSLGDPLSQVPNEGNDLIS